MKGLIPADDDDFCSYVKNKLASLTHTKFSLKNAISHLYPGCRSWFHFVVLLLVTFDERRKGIVKCACKISRNIHIYCREREENLK